MTTKRPKIPPELMDAMLGKAAEGMGVREISAWLKAEHSVSASHATVARYIARESKERSDTAKTVARTKLAKQVSSDLDVLTRERARMEKLTRKLFLRVNVKNPNNDDVLAYNRTVKVMTDITKSKLLFAGAGVQDSTDAVRGVVVLPIEEG